MLLYLVLRECAHQRLYAHAPWLRGYLFAAIEDYGRGITIDMSSIEESMRGIDPSNMEAMQEALSGGLFDLEHTPAQQAALTRLETTLALIEGWVDDVVSQATDKAMPQAERAARGGPPPARDGRPGRGDVRRPGRSRAAAPAAARRRRPVGCAARRRGPGGPRCGLGAPRRAPDGGRPRRPAGVLAAHPGGRRRRRRVRGVRRRAWRRCSTKAAPTSRGDDELRRRARPTPTRRR